MESPRQAERLPHRHRVVGVSVVLDIDYSWVGDLTLDLSYGALLLGIPKQVPTPLFLWQAQDSETHQVARKAEQPNSETPPGAPANCRTGHFQIRR